MTKVERRALWTGAGFHYRSHRPVGGRGVRSRNNDTRDAVLTFYGRLTAKTSTETAHAAPTGGCGRWIADRGCRVMHWRARICDALPTLVYLLAARCTSWPMWNAGPTRTGTTRNVRDLCCRSRLIDGDRVGRRYTDHWTSTARVQDSRDVRVGWQVANGYAPDVGISAV